MLYLQGVVVLLAIMLAEVAHGFWFSNYNAPKKMQGQTSPYSTRSEQFNWAGGPPYPMDPASQLHVALPVAVPLRDLPPQMAPPATIQSTLHSVRLVPCLCPISNELISKDYDTGNQQPYQPQQTSAQFSTMQQSGAAANPPA